MYTTSATLTIQLTRVDVFSNSHKESHEKASEWVVALDKLSKQFLTNAGFSVQTSVEYKTSIELPDTSQ